MVRSFRILETGPPQRRGPLTLVPVDAQHIYKVCTEAEVHAAQVAGVYQGSAADLRDGFIHLSTAEQLPGTLAKHFAGQVGLVVLTVVAPALGAGLRYEASRGGALFPHCYGPLPMTAVRAVRALPDDEGERAQWLASL